MTPLPDIDSLGTYGGALADYGAIEDPSTDRPAAAANKAYANVAMMTHMALRCWTRIQTHASAPTVVAHDALWGNATAAVPTVQRIALGRFTITWPASVTDELGVTHSVNLRAAWANVRTSTKWTANVVIATPNTLDVYMSDLGGTLGDNTGIHIDVWCI